MKLGGDEARLPLHEFSVVPPCLEKGRLVRLVEQKHAHKHDRRGVDRKLALNRERRVQRTYSGMRRSFGSMMSICYRGAISRPPKLGWRNENHVAQALHGLGGPDAVLKPSLAILQPGMNQIRQRATL
jgi:hypothetical protein